MRVCVCVCVYIELMPIVSLLTTTRTTTISHTFSLFYQDHALICLITDGVVTSIYCTHSEMANETEMDITICVLYWGQNCVCVNMQ